MVISTKTLGVGNAALDLAQSAATFEGAACTCHALPVLVIVKDRRAALDARKTVRLAQ